MARKEERNGKGWRWKWKRRKRRVIGCTAEEEWGIVENGSKGSNEGQEKGMWTG